MSGNPFELDWALTIVSENFFTTNALDQKRARRDIFTEPEAAFSLAFRLNDHFSCELEIGTSHERHEKFSSESEDIFFFGQSCSHQAGA